MGYIEILILASVDADELAGLVHQPGLWGIWEEQDRIHVFWNTAHWSPEVQALIHQALTHLGISDPAPHIRISRLPWQDWNAQWASLVEPVRIGKRFLIRPSWKPSEHDEPLIELIIDPKQAFGTGHHTTTQLVIEMMEEIIAGNERILDIGTGSGILGMAALRLGARDVLAIDTDAMAIQCAREYAFENNIHEGLRFHVGTLNDLSVEPYDIILANIDRRTLTTLSKDLHTYAKIGSRLLVSGLLLEDLKEVANDLTMRHWSVIESRKRGEWGALYLRLDTPALHGAPTAVPVSFPNIE